MAAGWLYLPPTTHARNPEPTAPHPGRSPEAKRMNIKSEWRDPLWPEFEPTSTAALASSHTWAVKSCFFSSPSQLLCAAFLLFVMLTGCSKAEAPPPPPPGVTVTPVAKTDVEIQQEWVG